MDVKSEGGEAECFRRNKRASQVVPCEDERAHVGAVSAPHSGNVCSMTRWGVSSEMCRGEWKHMHPNSAKIPPSVESEPAAAWSVSLGHHLSWRAVVCPLVEQQLRLLLRLLLPPGAPSTRPYFFMYHNDRSPPSVRRHLSSFPSPFLSPLSLCLVVCLWVWCCGWTVKEGKACPFIIDSSRRLDVDDTPCVTNVDSCCSTAGCLSQVFRIPPTRKREHRCSFLPEPRFRSCGENPLAAHKVLFPVLLASPSPPRPLHVPSSKASVTSDWTQAQPWSISQRSARHVRGGGRC